MDNHSKPLSGFTTSSCVSSCMNPSFPPSAIAVGSALSNPCHVPCLCTHDKSLNHVYVESGSLNSVEAGQRHIPKVCLCLAEKHILVCLFWTKLKPPVCENFNGSWVPNSPPRFQEDLVWCHPSWLHHERYQAVHHHWALALKKKLVRGCPVNVQCNSAHRLKWKMFWNSERTGNDLRSPNGVVDLQFLFDIANVTICLRSQLQDVSAAAVSSTVSKSNAELCHAN